jgi:hypothetical protein
MSKQLLQETVGAIEAINASRDAERERVIRLIGRMMDRFAGNHDVEKAMMNLLGQVATGLYVQDLEE